MILTEMPHAAFEDLKEPFLDLRSAAHVPDCECEGVRPGEHVSCAASTGAQNE